MPEILLAVASSSGASEPDTGLLLIAALGVAAFVVGHVTRRWVSEVIVFITIGIVIGPEVVGLIDGGTVENLDPVISLALGAIVFGIGERLELPVLRQIGSTLTPIALLEIALVFVLSFLGLLAVGLPVSYAYLLAAIAVSTSPTTLVAVIANRSARGRFTDHLLSATALDNLASAVLFGLGLPIVLAAETPGTREGAVAFFQLMVFSVVIGVIAGYVLRRWMDSLHRPGERLLFVLVVLVATVGVSRYAEAPVVLSTLIAGALLANDPRDTRPLFASLRTLEAPIFLVFFLVVGAGVHLEELASVGLAGFVYITARIVGKFAGGWIGAEVTRQGRQSNWGPWLGAGLSPFAGMAIGLAAFTLDKANQAGLDQLGQDVSTIVLGSVVVFELVGPIAVGKALDRTGDSGVDAVTVNGSAEAARAPHMIRHVLVPLSSPGMARRKAPQIVDLAASAGATLTGLHVVSRVRPDDEADDLPPALRLVELVASSRDVVFQPVVMVSDSVVDAIVATAIDQDVDLIVLGEPYPRALDRGGGRRIVHEVARRVSPGIRVMVVPTLERQTAGTDSAPRAGPAVTTPMIVVPDPPPRAVENPVAEPPGHGPA